MPSQKILVVPDSHVPFHDRKNWNLLLKVAKELQPDQVVIIGDFFDFLSVSHFPKPPGRFNLLKEEVKAGNHELDRLQDIVGDGVTYLEGNHEWRLERYLVQKAPELFGILSCKELFRIEERGWDWIPYHQHLLVGKVLFAHDLGHSGKYAGFQTLAAAGQCVVFGHTHRGGVESDGTVDGDHRFSMNVGWLGDASKIEYTHRAKTRGWQLGFGWINMDAKGLAAAQFCPIVSGKVCVDGQWIR